MSKTYSNKSFGFTFLWLSIVFTFIFGLYYRHSLWCSIPVAPGEAYGIGDILELYIGVQLILLILINIIFQIIKFFKAHWKMDKNDFISIGLIIIIPILYFYLNSMIRPVCNN